MNKTLAIALIATITVVTAILATNIAFLIPINQSSLENTNTYTSPVKPPYSDPRYCHNWLGIEVLKRLFNEREENTIVSPLSIYSALAMVYEASTDESREILASLLCANNGLGEFYWENIAELENKSKPAVLDISNSIWVDSELYKYVLENYTDYVTRYYDAEITSIPLGNDPRILRESFKIINKWVENRTRGLIDKIIPDDYIPENPLAAIFINTVYLKANWTIGFIEYGEKPFYTLDGVINVTMIGYDNMEIAKAVLYNWFKVVKIPLKTPELSYIILVPDKPEDIYRLIDSLDPRLLEDILADLEKRGQDVTKLLMPKLDLDTGIYSLKEILSDMGAKSLFEYIALWRMFDKEEFLRVAGPTYIDDVFHRVRFRADTSGIEAAAATAVTIVYTALIEGLEITIDKPFVFLVTSSNGLVIFIGVVVNPLG
ncbi:MAG: serpin family protein [Thermoprotei archaeon]